MCELLAMSCLYPARLTSSLTALASHAKGVSRNRDTTPADANPLVPWLEANGSATTLSIGYIRHATQGAIDLANTGPFIREIGGRMQVFAHNGYLKSLAQSSLSNNGPYQPVGDTDSELAFCLLLDRIRRLECPAGDKATLVHDGVPTAQRVVLIASVPLTYENWTPMPQGEVIAVRHGEIVATRLLSESTCATV